VKDGDYAVLVESPLDAVRLFGAGIPAVASLGAWVSRDQVTLMARCFSYVILALDNDKAGKEATAIVKPMLKKQGCAAIDWDYTGLVDADGDPAKDVGDVPDDAALLAAFTRTRTFGL
jgi:DNA primase